MREMSGLAAVLMLFFVWSIPETIALRHLLMLSALILLTPLSWRQGMVSWRANHWPALWLAAFTIWLVMQAVIISKETGWALGEIRGQWLNGCLALLIGTSLATRCRISRIPDARTVTTLLAAVLAMQALISVAESIAWWFETGRLLRQAVPLTGGKLEMSYVLNVLLAALTVDLLYRASRHERFLRVRWTTIAITILVALASAHLAGARNGIIGIGFLSLSAVALFAIERYRQKGFGIAVVSSAALVFLVVAFIYSSVMSDSRWATFAESARVGWDIDKYDTWKDIDRIPFPALESGAKLDDSAYLRVAFIHASLRVISENPLGVGYGRNAFAHALRKTDEVNVGHAHSGLLDLGIGGGIPAMALWLALLASLMLLGWRRYFREGDPHGLLLLLLATGYLGRMMLDSVNRDHMLQIFMFLTGYLLTVSAAPFRLAEAASEPRGLPRS